MKKKYRWSGIILLLIISLILIIGISNGISLDIDSLRDYIDSSKYSEIIFIAIWCIRLISFIPGVTLMILGGLIFEAEEAIILSLIGVVLSGIIVFAIAKMDIFNGLREKINKKHPEIMELIESYNYKILAVGVLCPIAPTDVIVFVSSYMGINFKKFVLIFSLANIPAIYLYSYLGDSFNGSIINTIMIIVTLIITGFFSSRLWKKMRCNLAKEN